MTEPLETPPDAATTIFGDRLELAGRYANLLAEEATVRGLIGPAELPRLWTRHLLNCAVVGELIVLDADLIDVGSGAGLPGIPLAIARPDLTVTLVEPLLRRSNWLEDVVARLDLANVRVLRGRAEELQGRCLGTYVTARAVAPLDRLARWCLPLVRRSGQLLAMKGKSAARELETAAPVLRELGGSEWEVCVVGSQTLVDPAVVVRVKVGASDLPTGRPRTAGQRSKRRNPGKLGGVR